MKLRSALLATAMMALPLAATHAQVAGPYVSLGGGVNIMQKERVTSLNGVSVPESHLHFDLGAVGVAAAGWGFGNGLRAELEFAFRHNGLDKVTTPFGDTKLSGSEQKLGPMVNILYDFTTVSPAVVPYVGVGVGYQWVRLKNNTGGVTVSNTDGAIGYQGILGAAIPIASVPGLGLTGEYRFMGVAGDRNYAGLKLGNNFNHAVLIGVRYAFGAPAPAPAPMPVADMGAKTFLVFFDWDKADLTARSEAIVRDAAAYSTRSSYTRIDVDGNTDTSGTPGYNQGLSERRARVVAAELVRNGVPQNVISMHAYGETHLLVPTGPNVREPQNRRVEIIFH